MTTFIVRRLIGFVPVLIVISILVFSLVHIAPGDPVDVIIGEDRADPEVIESIRHEMGFDQPAPVQYLKWAGRAIQGDFGFSYRSREPVIDIIMSRLPLTVELTVLSILFGLVVSIPLGTAAALYRNRWPDMIASVVSAIGISMPAFWLGILLIFLFTIHFGWLPPSGYIPFTEDPMQNLKHMILPTITLGSGYAAVLTRFFRGCLLDVMPQDFVRTGRAKGLAERRVLREYVFRNALIPIITIIGIETGRLLGGAILTETIFVLPGMGRLAVDAIVSRDFPTMQAAVLFMTLSVLLANLVVDILYGVIDPRIRV